MSSEWSVDGVLPGAVERPGSIDELSRLLADSARSARTVCCGGGLSKIGHGNAPRSVGLMISTRGLADLVEHAPGDLVVTAEAGMPLADLQAELAGSGQWLALDPPEPGATVGGVVAASASGPRRLRYGTPRDLLIGLTVVLADGTVARSGGKVVKNVAGYDLGKLFTGSFGSLGVIATCTFRLHPLPVARRVVTAEIQEAGVAVAAVKACGADPAAIEWDGERLVVVVDGSEAVAIAQATTVQAAIGGDISDVIPTDLGHRPWSGDSPTAVGLKLTHRLGALDEALATIVAVLPNARLRAHTGSGVIWIGHDEGHLDGLDELRRRARALDGQVVVVEAPPAVKAGVDVWGPARGLEVMRQIKARFDPDSRLAPGRFVGGL